MGVIRTVASVEVVMAVLCTGQPIRANEVVTSYLTGTDQCVILGIVTTQKSIVRVVTTIFMKPTTVILDVVVVFMDTN